jgi:hypothetical protein
MAKSTASAKVLPASSRATKKGKLRPAEVTFSWPDDCPVQSEDPSDEGLAQPSLPPDPALHACSGKDIHVSKGATSQNSSSGSGNNTSKPTRYLAILPGTLTLRKPAKTNAPLFPESLAEKVEDSVVADAADSSDVNKPEVRLLGRLQHASSTHPILTTAAFSDSSCAPTQGSLSFRGTSVATTSKFLVLTLQPKKGRIVCKHVFSNVIVFGDACLHGTGDAVPSVAPTSAIDAVSGKRFSSTSDDRKAAVAVIATVEPQGTTSNAASLSHQKLEPQDTCKKGEDDESVFMATTEKKQGNLKRLSTGGEPLSDSSDSDRDVVRHPNLEVSAMLPASRRPRRASRKPVQYNTVESGDKDSDTDPSGSEDNSNIDCSGKRKQPIAKPMANKRTRRLLSNAITQSQEVINDLDESIDINISEENGAVAYKPASENSVRRDHGSARPTETGKLAKSQPVCQNRRKSDANKQLEASSLSTSGTTKRHRIVQPATKTRPKSLSSNGQTELQKKVKLGKKSSFASPDIDSAMIVNSSVTAPENEAPSLPGSPVRQHRHPLTPSSSKKANKSTSTISSTPRKRRKRALAHATSPSKSRTIDLTLDTDLDSLG